jgi:anti-anti-sigma factor
MRDQLTIEVVPEHDHVTLRLTGEINMCTAESVRDAALTVMRQHSPNISIDLSGVTFLDPTGLEMLLTIRLRATLQGGELRLVDPARTMLRVLEVAGVHRCFSRADLIAAAEVTPAT